MTLYQLQILPPLSMLLCLSTAGGLHHATTAVSRIVSRFADVLCRGNSSLILLHRLPLHVSFGCILSSFLRRFVCSARLWSSGGSGRWKAMSLEVRDARPTCLYLCHHWCISLGPC
ncbi:hypothetical protein B0J12DRAFT_648191 [Macrophomina phaseolina]|uniref:Secreted protein n=1 Tax=Macrophomina phaseolina TaxID=35725 RepID=A0ABQ8GP24_9PEZI|nr:hypothetical protein B0J12DRAFT_648191 [Macrophomina phaseolina]